MSESKPVAVFESKPPAESESKPAAKPVPAQPDATVLVEAAPLVTAESHETSASASAPDIDLQTADTANLEPIEDASGTSTFDAQAFEDTIEVEPQFDHVMNASSGHLAPVASAVEYARPTSMSEPLYTPEPSRPTFNDVLLDLDDSDFGVAAIADDVVLDLEDETPAAPQSSSAHPYEMAVMEAPVAVAAEPKMAVPEPVVAEAEPEVVAEAMPSAAGWWSRQSQMSSDQLSPELIDAIARRVVEHLSDRVVREIAWEVVPELSEILIKKKLEEQK